MKNIFMLTLGILFYFMIQIDIGNVKHESRNSSLFSFNVNSHIPQQIKLHVSANKHEFIYIHCNDEKISYSIQGYRWYEGKQEEAVFNVKSGNNSCYAMANNKDSAFVPIIKQKLTFLNYIILFAFIGFPLIHLIFITFIRLLNTIKTKFAQFEIYQPHNETINSRKKLPILIPTIIAIGILIRIFYFQKFGITSFQHDWQGHVEFIKYISTNWSLPIPSKGLQFPQQPLYYIISAILYTLGIKLGMNGMDTLYIVGYLSLICSILFLYYTYKFIVLLTNNKWTQTVAVLFVSFTPSLVYLSARINNDSLVLVLSIVSLFYIVKSYQSNFLESFIPALLWTSLLFLAKISASPIELLLFALLIWKYLQSNLDEDIDYLKRKLYLFSLVGILLLGFTLFKNYLPIENTIRMVNSSGGFPGQIIKSLDMSYFFTFNISSLIDTGYSYVFGNDNIRYSFLTYQYGTMFFGEFGYSSFIKQHEWLKIIMQIILASGLVYILGLLFFIARLHKASMLHILLFTTLTLNFLLILEFMLTYSVVCNTDFRYYVASFGLFAFVFAQGLTYINDYSKWMKYILSLAIGVLSISELTYFMFMLII
jgi:hypothetical protein